MVYSIALIKEIFLQNSNGAQVWTPLAKEVGFELTWRKVEAMVHYQGRGMPATDKSGLRVKDTYNR